MRLLLILVTAAGLTATAIASKAALGWTLDESVQHYGAPEVVWIPLMETSREWLGCTGKLQVRCWAQLNASRTSLVIATIEDYNAVHAAEGS